MADILASYSLGAIRVFETAARLKSFTRAADELGVTQAAVSWQVKALEQRLGQPLFVRRVREVDLTPAGERLARAATESMALLRAALSDLVESDEGVLAVTTLQSLATHWLAPRLGGFQLAHPGLAVRLETSHAMRDLSRGEADLGLRSGAGPWPGLTSHFLMPFVQAPLCSPNFLANAGGFERPADLLKATRIGNAREWAIWFEAAGVSPPDAVAAPRLEADAQSLEVASAMAGQGLALGSPIFFAPDIAAGRLVQPFDIAPSYGGGYWLVYPEDRRRVRKIAAFRDWILDAVAADPAIARYPASPAP
jgi:LysR family glycine cleavage system transcriptional activator